MTPRVSAPVASTAHTRGVFLMLASAACFIANVLLIRGIATFATVDVWLVSCARFVVGLLMVAIWYRREWQPANLLRNGKLIERGLIGGLTVAGFYATIVQLGAGRATFINNTYLVWGALLAVFLLRERLRPALAVGSAAALVGLGLLTGAFASGAAVGVYDLVAVVTAIGAGYVVVTIRQLHASEHTSTIFSAQCVYGLLFCAIPAWLHWHAVAPSAWGLLVAASLCAGGGQIFMTLSFRELSVAEGSLLQMIVPLGITLGEVMLFAERFTATELSGAAMILAGCALPAWPRPGRPGIADT